MSQFASFAIIARDCVGKPEAGGLRFKRGEMSILRAHGKSATTRTGNF